MSSRAMRAVRRYAPNASGSLVSGAGIRAGMEGSNRAAENMEET